MIVSVTITDSREDQIAGAVHSVVDHVDRVLVVDTGATDRTVKRAREIARKKLSVVKHRWTDFSGARNASLDAAKKLGAEWTVIVDSDERINFGALNLRSALSSAKADVLLVESDDGHYPKEKVLRADSEARFFGPTHEALLGGKRALLRGATFSELPKTDEQLKRKLKRDIDLLEAFIEKRPKDPRWWYYLGSSFEGVGQRKRAAEAFGRCARLRKTGYEAAWAAFKEAEQLVALGRYDEAIEAAARGMRADATFPECACVAAEAAFKVGRSEQAVAWARIAESIGRFRGNATERLWFRDLPSLYERPYETLRMTLPDKEGREKAELDYRTAKIARVRAVNNIEISDPDWLSVSRSVAAPDRDEARSMLRPPTLDRLCRSARAVQIKFSPAGRWPMNPSICRHRGELWCVVRTVNYSIYGRQYTIHDPHGIARTENYIGKLKPDGTLVAPTLMRDLDRSPRRPSNILGYEDVRLVSLKGRSGDVLAGSATVCDRDPDRRLIARLHLDGLGNVKRADVQPSNQPHEKNWMPLAVDGKFVYIYSLDPTAILPGPLRDCPLALEHLRGGAAMPYKGGYLCVTHEVVDTVERRLYLHRFVRLDKSWNVVAVSPAWIFAHYGIEFCAGIARDKEQIVLSYGLDDREAWITRVDEDEVERMKWITP